MSRKSSSSSSRKSSPRAKRSSGGGIIVGICIGIMLGAVLAAAVAWMLSKDKPFHEAKSAPPSLPVASGQQPAALPGQPGAQPIEKQDFDFYKILPNGETPKSMAALDAGRSGEAAAPLSAERFYLQVGSFEDPSEADNMRAMLALNGLEAITQRAQLPDGRVVNRVRLGPFVRPEDMKQTQSRLAQAGFTANVVR